MVYMAPRIIFKNKANPMMAIKKKVIKNFRMYESTSKLSYYSGRIVPFKLIGELIMSITAPTTTFQKTNFATWRSFIDFQDYFKSLFRLSSASRPLVPHDISSILHRANVFKIFR